MLALESERVAGKTWRVQGKVVSWQIRLREVLILATGSLNMIPVVEMNAGCEE